MNSPSKRYPMMVLVDEPTMQDAIMVCRRTDATLAAVLADALHQGMPAYVDKWEAIFARDHVTYPLIDTSVADVAKYLYNTHTPDEADVAILRRSYVERQLQARQGGL